METLGEDLVLLSVHPDNGTIVTKSRLGYGLRGSELVRLAAGGRAGITGDRIVVLNSRPTGDEQLDAALASLAGARRPPRQDVGRPPGVTDRGHLSGPAGRRGGDPRRPAHASRVHPGPPVAGRGHRPARGHPGPAGRDRPCCRPGGHGADRLRGAGQRQRPGPRAVPGDGQPAPAQAPRADRQGRADAGRRLRPRLPKLLAPRTRRPAARAGADAATSAATDAATQAAIQAATHAAVSAAVHAAHQAASDGGHGGHGGEPPAAGTTSLASLCAEGPGRSGADLADQAAGHPAGQGRPGLRAAPARPGRPATWSRSARCSGASEPNSTLPASVVNQAAQAGPAGAAPG